MKFDRMDVWMRAVELSVEAYKYSTKIRDYGFRDQLTRSALSIPSNIAEGVERESIKESINFLSYAKASAGEFYTQVFIGKKAGFLDIDVAERWLQESKEITAILAAIMKKRRQFT
ncbi:four helix bundle protein [Pleionea mediterranea]|uniref:Four helix bundle protein n=1 Tax=Pleionea mediterranea TaxID=523701 RepID=A0A316FTD8_9GAMM|nr:four helix bundle protein [Pleionea mediterranea]PWK50870.1 four helix bundle protein [Pleionea mediterranea]